VKEKKMRFGFMDHLPCAEWQSEGQRYSDILGQIELGDKVGFDTAWLAEIHFFPNVSRIASPLTVLAAAAQRTERIRLGTAVTLLPLHNPLKIAEDAATVDILSDGRLELGVGRGAAPMMFTAYNVPVEETRERFEEALAVIRQAWTSDRLTFEGKYWRMQDLQVFPRPVQKPHPPLRIAANSPETYTIAGRLGLPIFATPLIAGSMEKLREYIGAHRDSLPSGVKQDVAVAFPVHAAPSREQARREVEPSVMHFFSFLEQRRPDIQALPESYQSLQRAVDRLAKITYEEVEDLGAAFGDPDYCVERVRALQREFGMNEFICYFNQGGLVEPAVVRRSMELFAREVIPHCR
jgi:alkanesulfonate monooxygenase SsuD/methylene tetrahydromethanopterin reductase-like flavin-dependent oxidoreductase (luciferase family)